MTKKSKADAQVERDEQDAELREELRQEVKEMEYDPPADTRSVWQKIKDWLGI